MQLSCVVLFILIVARLCHSNGIITQVTTLNEHPRENIVLLRLFNPKDDNVKYTASIEAIEEKFKSAFIIDNFTGELRTTKEAKNVIDHEEICQGILCQIEILILINKSELMKVTVNITDIDDNLPIFVTGAYQEVAIREGNYYIRKRTVPLDGAYDPDRGINSDINYRLQTENSAKGIFDLLKNETGLYLVVKDDLDFEKEQLYTMKLIACEGDIVNCIQQELLVNVENVNDFPPKFDKELYMVPINDSHGINEEIIHLNYIDMDKGDYGRVKFSLLNHQDLFGIDKKTGSVYLRNQTLMKDHYQLRVKIEDSYHRNYSRILKPIPKSFTSEATLVINVQDTNNHSPEVQVRSVNLLEKDQGIDTHQNAPVLWVRENSPAPINVGYITVVDRDHGENARVACKIKSYHPNFFRSDVFSIKFSNSINAQTSVFKVVLNQPLDAEALFPNDDSNQRVDTTVYSQGNIAGFIRLAINCSDFGKPSNSISKDVFLGVLDEDEHQKTFQYDNNGPILVSENTSNIVIYQMKVHDSDSAPNTHFRIIRDSTIDDLEFVEERSQFRIDPQTGVISIKSGIDAELISDIFLTIGAREASQQNFDEITHVIKIKVLDVNDNTPKIIEPLITQKVYNKNYDGIRDLRVLENRHVGTIVTRLKAVDNDLDPKHNQVEFAIEKLSPFYTTNFKRNMDSNTWPRSSDYFTLTKEGILLTEHKFDAEEIERFELLIEARDNGEPSLRSTTLLRITIDDVNDNHPVWKFPTTSDNRIEVDRSLEVNSIVTRVKAMDNDSSKNNNQVSYFIRKNNSNHYSTFFTIKENVGEVILKKDLSQLKETRLQLDLEACDTQKKTECAQSYLLIELKVIKSKDIGALKRMTGHLFNNSLDGMQNLLALSGGILGGLLLTAVLIAVLLLFICRKRKLNFLPKDFDKSGKYFHYKMTNSKLQTNDMKGVNMNKTIYTSWLSENHQGDLNNYTTYQTTPRNLQKLQETSSYNCTQNATLNLFSDTNSVQGSSPENILANGAAQIITTPQEFYFIQPKQQQGIPITTSTSSTTSPIATSAYPEHYFINQPNFQYDFDENQPYCQKILSLPISNYVQ